MFGSKKIVVVASVAYNLGRTDHKRPNYLKSLVVRNVLSGTKEPISATVRKGLIEGPYTSLKTFFRWSQRPGNYHKIGLPSGKVSHTSNVNADVVATAIPRSPGHHVAVESASAGIADLTLWAERYILDHYPADYDTAWAIDYSDATKELTIRFVDHTHVIVSVPDFIFSSRYIYSYYRTYTSSYSSGLTTGSTHDVVGVDFPSTTDWVVGEDTTVSHIASLTTGDEYYLKGHRVYTRSVYLGEFNGEFRYRDETMYHIYDGEVVNDALILNNKYRIDHITHYSDVYSPLRMFIYRIGSGNPSLDYLDYSTATFTEFFPFIPFRIENQFLTDYTKPNALPPGATPQQIVAYNVALDRYETSEQLQKAYRKATGSKLSELVSELKKSPSLGDIDHAYVVLGAALNSPDIPSRKYIYKFFERMHTTQANGPNARQAYLNFLASQNPIISAWMVWRRKKSDAGPEPQRPVFGRPPMNEIRINGSGSLDTRYDVRIMWGFITNGVGAGQGRAGAKAGDCWFEHLGTTLEIPTGVTTIRTGPEGEYDYVQTFEKLHTIRLYWQRTANSFTYLDITDSHHFNYIYRGHSEAIEGHEALADPDESGFIIPLHYPTWRDFNIVDGNQMSSTCIYAVFNCYHVYKQRWYQRGIFKALFVLVIAIASVFFAPAAIGLFGSHLAVGVSLGFSGMTAAIVGAVVNTIAALVLSSLLEVIAADLGILGPIVAFMTSFLVGGVINSFNTGTLALNWGDIMRADNLLRITDAVGQGISKQLQLDTLSLQTEMQDFAKQTEEEARKIQQAYFNEFGYGAGIIDPWQFVDSSYNNFGESRDTFLTRTLMTGSEVSEMSHSLLSDFPELSLKLPDAFT